MGEIGPSSALFPFSRFEKRHTRRVGGGFSFDLFHVFPVAGMAFFKEMKYD